ncbi:MAG TPA: type II toxin-antitoxin system HicA family toxin [Phycisphaerae bacterium]|jgi:predicted RNA binding protein YcfA (HicA-like mRNA interferase family)
MLPILRSKQVVAALERAGFVRVRQTGSHAHYRKGTLTVTVPMHARDLKRGTLASILRQAHMTPKELNELL